MKFSLKQYLQGTDKAKPTHHSTTQSQSSSNPNKAMFENWLNANLDQKNLKSHDLHIEEYEEIPEENLHPLDYRIEIERRFRNSVVNKIYIFPRKDEMSISSDNSSLDSIKRVTLYELVSQNFQKCVKNEEKPEKIEKEIPLGVNYKQFLNILEKTIKNVNISDLKKIKMNNYFKKEGNDIMTPHFLSTTHKDAKQKHEGKFKLRNPTMEGSVGKTNKTMENSSENKSLQKRSPDNQTNIKNLSKSNYQNIHANANNFIKTKKLNINPRTQAISFTQNNQSQVNTPSYSINKT